MATTQLISAASSISAERFISFEGLRASNAVKASSFSPLKQNGLSVRSFRGLVVTAATTIGPKYTSLKPLGERVLVKIKTAEEKTSGGILLPTTAQSKPQGGEVVAIGEGRTIGKNKVDISVKTGAQVVYSKYAGTEVEFNGSNHLILKEDDIVGILDTNDVKDMTPLNDRVLIKFSDIKSRRYLFHSAMHVIPLDNYSAEAEEKTAGGLYLADASKEKPSIGTVIVVGPGPLDEEGKRKPLSVAPGNTVLYLKYAGNDFKGTDGSDYIALWVSDVMAVLS